QGLVSEGARRGQGWCLGKPRNAAIACPWPHPKDRPALPGGATRQSGGNPLYDPERKQPCPALQIPDI
ncbi:MAG: hypothetical protein V7642_3680, partial [Burkholderiales bacterium]